MFKNLNEARIIAGVGMAEIADYLGMSYVEAAKIFHHEVSCNKEVKEKIKNFLVENYTDCIDKVM